MIGYNSCISKKVKYNEDRGNAMALYLKEGDSYYKNIPSNNVRELCTKQK